jgi:hypothetical protein
VNETGTIIQAPATTTTTTVQTAQHIQICVCCHTRSRGWPSREVHSGVPALSLHFFETLPDNFREKDLKTIRGPIEKPEKKNNDNKNTYTVSFRRPS